MSERCKEPVARTYVVDCGSELNENGECRVYGHDAPKYAARHPVARLIHIEEDVDLGIPPARLPLEVESIPVAAEARMMIGSDGRKHPEVADCAVMLCAPVLFAAASPEQKVEPCAWCASVADILRAYADVREEEGTVPL